MPKKYAIVRVDKLCPTAVEEKFLCVRKTCRKCEDNYGDTKEQMIKKIAQALKGTLWNDRKGMSYEEISKEIIEFLGVE